MTENVRKAQKAAVQRYHDAGMSRRDMEAVLGELDDGVGWYSVDGSFERRWYRGIDEVRRFLAAMFENTTVFTFHVGRLIADDDVPDVVVAEWENEAVFRDGASYANRGSTIFVFTPGTEKIREIRQYFDWGPLMARADWRASVGAGA
ncbi:MAG TPA: nuclear transport factor 2 family protein [Gaiellaceae bacterium]|jgi:ketosteroid isomerase-like protein|nr:nuclear transport factor 2 family protein [Gaiellaceae bacterium]